LKWCFPITPKNITQMSGNKKSTPMSKVYFFQLDAFMLIKPLSPS
jgi:hypothetical protein